MAFSSRDTYQETRRKFNTAWPNLRIEIHVADVFYYKEGMNEVEQDCVFNAENEMSRTFIINDDTTIDAAENLFVQNFRLGNDQLAVQIIDNFTDKWIPPVGAQTLAEASDPFILRPVDFTYGEFQLRFTEHWPNLSIQLFQGEHAELPAEMELKNLKGTAIHGLIRGRVHVQNGVFGTVEIISDNYLHDHLYILDYKNALEKSGIVMAIKNIRTGEDWNAASSPDKIIDFQNAK